MILNFLANLALALRRPRLSARWMLDRAPAAQDCALIVLLSGLVQVVFVEAASMIVAAARGPADASALEAFAGGDETGLSLASIMFQLAETGVVAAVMTAAAWAIGARFGGRASLIETGRVVAWYSLVAACLAPLHLLGFSAVDMEAGEVSILFLLAPLAAGLQIWIFAAFVAEAHGFAKLGGVIVVTIAGMLALGFLSLMLVSMLAGGPPPA